MEVATIGAMSDSKSSMSVSISTFDDSTASSVEGHSMIRPVLLTRKSLSSRMLTKNTSIPSNEMNKTIMTSNSTHRFSHFKKVISSLAQKKSDSYQKIDSTKRSLNSDISSKYNGIPSSTHPMKSNLPPRPGVRRRRSFDDDFQSLYRAAAMVVRREESHRHVDKGDEENTRHSALLGNHIRRHSAIVGNPQSADELPVHGGSSANIKNHSFVPSNLSSPDLLYRALGTGEWNIATPTSSTSSKSSGDLLTRAAAVAGRKHRKQLVPRHTTSATPSNASSIDLFSPKPGPLEKISAPQPAYSSSPHLLARAGAVSRQKQPNHSDSAVDLFAFSNKYLYNSVNATPRIAGSHQRRSKRLIPNETVMQHSNDAHKRLQDSFRKDFPDEPIPSDAILVRLYGNINIPPPPPPPYTNMLDEQASASNGITSTPPWNSLKKNSDHTAMTAMTFTSEPEWNACKDSVDQPRRKRNTNDDSRRSESSKSKGSSVSSRRSTSNPRLADAADRSYSRSHSHSHTGSRSRSRKSRRGSKSKTDSNTSGRDSSRSHEAKISKSNGNKRRDGMSHSSHGKTYASTPVGTPKSKGRKRGETMKIKTKTVSRKSPSDEYSSPSYTSDNDAFNALLDLSNGSFFDSGDGGSEHKTSSSLAFLKTSLPRVNSSPKMSSMSSFNDSANSFAEIFIESDEKMDKERNEKERKMRRRGKRSDGKIRSKSFDENNFSTKSRRGKRSSKSKTSKIDDEKKPSSYSRPDESNSYEFNLSLLESQWNSISEIGKQHKSPKFLTRKNVCNESEVKQECKTLKSPKLHTKKNLSHEKSGSPSSLMSRKKNKHPNLDHSSKSCRDHSSKSCRDRSSKSCRDHSSKSCRDHSSKSCRSITQDIYFESSPKCGVSKIAAKEDNEFALSSWGDKSLNNEVLIENDLTRKTRWNPEPSSMLNAMSPRIDYDTAGAKVPCFDSIPSPAPPSPPAPTPKPKETKKINFPLNFLEYEDVSPLTIASKKIGKLDIQTLIATLSSMNGIEGAA